MNKNGVIAVVVVVVAIVLAGLWALRSGEPRMPGVECTSPPSPPQGVTHTVEGDLVTIRWSPAPAGEHVATYVIEARVPQEAPFSFIAPGNATSFERKGPLGSTHHVHLIARNACGSSAPSPEMIIKIP
jgi:hypothetical protein